MAQILNAAEKGARKTHILYQCKLSFKQLNAYLEFLADMGLLKSITLQTDNNGDFLLFETTNKGKDFVKAYYILRALLMVRKVADSLN